MPGTKGWREEFEKKFCDSSTGGVMPRHRDGSKILREGLDEFIDSLLSARTEECAREVEGMVVDLRPISIDEGSTPTVRLVREQAAKRIRALDGRGGEE